MDSMEFVLDFTDITLGEADGVFGEVDELMRAEPGMREAPWVVRSTVTIRSNVGIGSMIIQCHSDKNIYILDYEPSIGELFYNPDIQAFSVWAQSSGWNIPQPHPDLVKTNKEFWKHFYDTLVIDSDYLDSLYGKREQLGEKDE